MTHKPSSRKIQKELDRLEKTGEEFLLFDVAYRLNSTSQKIVRELQLREPDTVMCVERPTGKYGGQCYSRYKFVKQEEIM